MNPLSSNEQVGFNLPPPHPELPALQLATEGAPKPFERGRSAAERAPGTNGAPQPLASAMLPLPPSFASSAMSQGKGSDVSSTTTSVVSTTADDSDLIEKEWVSKAKAIVEKTQNDPYQQSKELNFLRAGYMQERYSKHIKLSE